MMHVIKRLFMAVLVGSPMCATPLQPQTSRTFEYLATLTRAEAATRASNWADAAALWAQVVERNPHDGRFWNELGNARANTGDYRQAISAYQRVIELGWGIPANTAYTIATTYARLREKELALQWLDTAFQMGYRGVNLARRDVNLRLLQHRLLNFRNPIDFCLHRSSLAHVS